MEFNDIYRNKSDYAAEQQGCFFDQSKADRIIKFSESVLLAPQGRRAGQVTLLDWQRSLLRYVWGWRNADGTRRIRWLYLQVGRRNGKSFVCFILSMAVLLLGEDTSPYVLTAACDREQATTIYDFCAYTIKRNKRLNKALHCKASNSTIQFPKRNGEFRAIGSLAANARSKSPVLCIIDEICHHRKADLYNAIKPSIADRQNGLLLLASSPGLDKSHFTYDECYLTGKKLNAGDIIDKTAAAFIYEADAGCAVDDPDQWEKANPSIHELHSLADYEAESGKAARSKIAEGTFRQERLGQWQAQSLAHFNIDHFESCVGSFPPILNTLPAIYALDGSTRSDLTAVCKAVVYDDKVFVTTHAFIPEEGFQKREKSNLSKYSRFQAEQTLTLTEGNEQDFSKLRQWIFDQPNPCHAMIFDSTELVETMQIMRNKGYNVLEFPPSTKSYNGPMRLLEQLLAERRIVHEGKQLLLWAMGNMTVERDQWQRVKPSKSRSVDKIDPAVCLVMCMSMVSELLHKQDNPWNKSGFLLD